MDNNKGPVVVSTTAAAAAAAAGGANNNNNNNSTVASPTRDVLHPLSQSTAETWLSIASLAETLGDADRAAMAYDATLQHNHSSTKALTSLAHLYRSRDMFQKAAELYERALVVNPELSDVWATLGHCYLMLDDLQRAYNAYQQALYHLSNPNVPKLWHGIGILYDRYGSLDYAEEAFAKVLELDPNFEKANEIYFRLGIIYKHQGKFTQALECFRYILPQPPAPLQEWDIWFQLGSVLENMGEWQGAREAYEHVLLQNEHHAKVLQQLGCLYGMNNIQFYDPQKALNLLLKSLESDPSDAATWYHLGRVHMIRSDYTAAYDAFQQAVNRDSRNPIFWCSIGVLYYQISQYRDALDAYTRAIRLNPYISEVWYDLGTLYETCNNQLSDALDAYKQAARLDPDNVHIRERLETLTQQLTNQNQQQQQQQSQQQQSQQQQPSQLQSNGAIMGPVANSAPVMLQPNLQATDQANPLNIKPAQLPQQTAGVYSNNSLLNQPQQHAPPQVYPVPVQQVMPNQQSPQQVQQMIHPPQLNQHVLVANQPQQPQQLTQVVTPSMPNTSLPQKRPMDGSINTLVNAVVSTTENPMSVNPLSNSTAKGTTKGKQNKYHEQPQSKKSKTSTSSPTIKAKKDKAAAGERADETKLAPIMSPQEKTAVDDTTQAYQLPSMAPPPAQVSNDTNDKTESKENQKVESTTEDEHAINQEHPVPTQEVVLKDIPDKNKTDDVSLSSEKTASSQADINVATSGESQKEANEAVDALKLDKVGSKEVATGTTEHDTTTTTNNSTETKEPEVATTGNVDQSATSVAVEGSSEQPASETIIAPSADALEKLKEEAKLREEEEREKQEQEEKAHAQKDGSSSNLTVPTQTSGDAELDKPPAESVLRQVEEDENYDD